MNYKSIILSFIGRSREKKGIMFCNTNMSNVVSEHLNVTEADNVLFQWSEFFCKALQVVNKINKKLINEEGILC